MDFCGIWGQLILNGREVLPGIQIVAPCIGSVAVRNSSSPISRTEDSETQQDSDNECEPDEKDDDVEHETKHRKAIQRIRYSKEEYRCNQCPYTCTTEKAFFRHSRSCEPKSGGGAHLVSCAVCGKDRHDEDGLAAHMLKHKQAKHFCCDLCKFKSLQLKKLIQHRRMHTGEKPHLCPFCIYRSSRRDNLRSHVRRVHKRSDLPCDTFTPRSMIVTARKTNEI